MDGPTFRNRDYDDRTVPEDAVILEQGDEPELTVYAWDDPDADCIWLQQGYDLIPLYADSIAALHNFVRVTAP